MEEGTEANAGSCTNNYPRTTGILMIKKFKTLTLFTFVHDPGPYFTFL